jgi:hypothetical protein
MDHEAVCGKHFFQNLSPPFEGGLHGGNRSSFPTTPDDKGGAVPWREAASAVGGKIIGDFVKDRPFLEHS